MTFHTKTTPQNMLRYGRGLRTQWGHEDPLTMVKRRKLKWYGYVTCQDLQDLPNQSYKDEKEKNMEKEMGEPHHRMDRRKPKRQCEEGGVQNEMERAGR